jgi:preprotein translocase subunit SecE
MRLMGRVTERFRAANFLRRAHRAVSGIKIMANPLEFIQQVRTEATKVVWPSRRETLITTGLVMLMALFASIFFIVVDEGLRVLVSLVLGFGRSG